MFKVKLQYFSNRLNVDDFDFEKEVEEFENEWSDDEPETDESETEEETEEEELDDDQSEEETDEEESEEEDEEEEGDEEEQDEEEDEQEQPPLDNKAQDRAFQRLRQEAQAGKKATKFLQTLAEQAGLNNIEELMEVYEERQIAKQAEEEGKPVETIRREKREAQQQQEQARLQRAEAFNTDVKVAIAKHNLKDNDVQAVIQYMANNGYVSEEGDPTIKFEDAYFLANKETFQKQERSKGQQEYLEKKKKRVKNSAVPTGKSVTKVDTNEIDDDFVDAELKRMGIEI